MVASDGGIFSFVTPFDGSMGGAPLAAPIVGIASAPSASSPAQGLATIPIKQR